MYEACNMIGESNMYYLYYLLYIPPVKKQFKGQYGDSVGKEYLSLHPELGLETWPEPPSNPSAAKFLRF